METKLFVGNLPYSVGDDDLEDVFADHGSVVSVVVIRDRETGRSRGFGSIKVTARIGETVWKTSVFPQQKQSEWVLLVSKKVMRLEGIAHEDVISVEVTPI